jgi:hypothetical protein
MDALSRRNSIAPKPINTQIKSIAVKSADGFGLAVGGEGIRDQPFAHRSEFASKLAPANRGQLALH